ncbi:MAG: class I tRNA ligase family protein, partial [Candidatus Dojkabacteria bacterium]
VDSSWYFFRHIDSKNSNKIFEKERANYWLPTDLYMIGAEHIVLHLLYARFFTKFFFDEGIINFDEPFMKMRHMGIIAGPDGRKMSKRWGNVINPNDEIQKYSADTVRMYEMFMGPLADPKPWNDRSENGVFRFLNKVWDVGMRHASSNEEMKELKNEEIKSQQRLINKLIKRISEDTEVLSFNTAIARFMEFINAISTFEKIDKSVWETFIKVLAPYAPFITEELWEKLGNTYSIHLQKWPEFDPELIKDDVITMGVQINGKVRGTIQISPEAEEKDAMELAKADEKISKNIIGEPKKVIYIKGKILNIII